MKLNTTDLTSILKASESPVSGLIEINDISIDSRSLRNTKGTLYFAIEGIFHNGHDYIEELIRKEVTYFVVRTVPENVKGKATFFVVEDTLKSLQEFVAYYRTLFDIPVIGITGSNGKTIVKEWLNFLLHPFYNIIKSPKSYNSQVGVPLSVIGINEKHTLGIFEAGISLPGEMAVLEKIIQPTIGILTSIGSAHNEGFENLDQKIDEKLKLFKGVDVLIYEKNESIQKKTASIQSHYDWSFTAEARVRFQHIKDNTYTVNYDANSFSVDFPFSDQASVHNIASCITTLLALGIDTAYIQDKITQLYRVEMRLQVKNGLQQCTLIDDSYSSDYQSLKIALDFLEQQKTHPQKTVILSDILQSGFSDEILYQKVGTLLQNNNINRIIGIGPNISFYLKHLQHFEGFHSTLDFLNHFDLKKFKDETILIKGARSYAFEQIVSELEEKTHETVLEINLNAISHNFNFYKSKLLPETKTMVMVKAFGYGNGSYEIAKLLAFHKVDYLGVAFADEGVVLRKSGIKSAIIVMNPENSAFSTMISYQLEPEIYSLPELKTFLTEAKKHSLYEYPIHIKLNTGMNRLGFNDTHFEELIAILESTNSVKVASIFSHLATSDMPEERKFTLQQIKLFQKWSSYLMDQLRIKPIRHILNTSGIFNFPEYQMEMVRLGIGLYGVGNSKQENEKLQNVTTLKTIILQLNDVEEGESVGYGRRFIADKPTKTATIPIGYADGIRRAYGNGKGEVSINGKRAKIIGSICMDMMMIDVTDTGAVVGDEVIIFGEEIPITEIALKWETIPYEVMTSISQRVKRIFFKE